MSDSLNISIIENWLLKFDLAEPLGEIIALALITFFIFVLAFTATFLIRRLILPRCLNWIANNNYKWDNSLVKYGFFNRASWFIPIIVTTLSIDVLLNHNSGFYILVKRIATAAYILVTATTLSALIETIYDIQRYFRKGERHLLRAYFDAIKIVLFLLAAILTISVFTGRSPWGILSVLGGLTAITMLIFKDTILGFVASIQLASSGLVKVGDWIEMPNYGADGDVISMSIHAVLVQNFDKTIISIPPYALISSSFKNWRGMSEAGARRIKRAINIDINSISFCSDNMLEKFGNVEIISKYIETKQHEINMYNEQHTARIPGMALNTRKQTNIGIFRAYIIAFLRSHPMISKNMTFLVRQLPPKETGLPLEIYVFSTDTRWVNYEYLQADIFDHLLAAVPEFGLRIFQNPTGYDMRAMGSEKKQRSS